MMALSLALVALAATAGLAASLGVATMLHRAEVRAAALDADLDRRRAEMLRTVSDAGCPWE